MLIAGFFFGCSGASYDSNHLYANPLLIESSIYQVNLSLSKGDCDASYLSIFPIYNSLNSNNAVRSSMAATYGCYAKVNVLNLLQNLLSMSSSLNILEFFKFLALSFPSQATPVDDKIPQSAQNGMDALIAMLGSTAIVIPDYKILSDLNNPGSLIFTDRVDDSNSYMMFLSMALMGSLGYRYGLPDSSGNKTVNLPWSDVTKTNGDGCTYASAFLNFKDSIGFLSLKSSGSLQTLYQFINQFISLALDQACSFGCLSCGVSCTSCPIQLRNRTLCTGVSTDIYSCAASGIAHFVNQVWIGP